MLPPPKFGYRSRMGPMPTAASRSCPVATVLLVCGGFYVLVRMGPKGGGGRPGGPNVPHAATRCLQNLAFPTLLLRSRV